MNVHDTRWIVPIIGFFAVLFLVAAGMAFLGVGYAGVTQRSFGGGWYHQSVEYADAFFCGFTMGLAVFIAAIAELPFPEVFPRGLAAIVAKGWNPCLRDSYHSLWPILLLETGG